jgi:hypothetical protein
MDECVDSFAAEQDWETNSNGSPLASNNVQRQPPFTEGIAGGIQTKLELRDATNPGFSYVISDPSRGANYPQMRITQVKKISRTAGLHSGGGRAESSTARVLNHVAQTLSTRSRAQEAPVAKRGPYKRKAA